MIELRLRLADAWARAGEHHEAASVLRGLAEDLTETNGADDAAVLACRFREAVCVFNGGDSETALRQAYQLLLDELRVFGEDDQEPLELRKQIGLMLRRAGRVSEARATLVGLVEHQERLNGPRHPVVGELRSLLAEISRSQHQ